VYEPTIVAATASALHRQSMTITANPRRPPPIHDDHRQSTPPTANPRRPPPIHDDHRQSTPPTANP
jgi:hypothetical protein